MDDKLIHSIISISITSSVSAGIVLIFKGNNKKMIKIAGIYGGLYGGILSITQSLYYKKI